MNIIGIDFGSTLAKIIECDEKGELINKMLLKEKDFKKTMTDFVSSNDIDISNIEAIVITGVGASKVADEDFGGVKIIKDNEFLCIARGGLELAGKKEAIIASMGTGTAFVRVSKEDIKHLGGTGVGGGTLIHLCSKFVGTSSFDEIVELAKSGDLGNVDLRISDISEEEIPGLPKDITACNFGKLSPEATDSDIALGIINMIFETIGMLAVFATKNDTIQKIITVGSLTMVPQGQRVFRMLEDLCNVRFITPENAEIAVAIGAVKRYLETI